MRKSIVVLLCVFLFFSSIKFVFGENLANVNWYIDGDKLRIDLKAPVKIAYSSFTLTDPNRLVIDVYNVTLSKSQSFEINKSPIRALRMAPRDDNKLRITLEGSKIPKYYINLTQDGLVLSIIAQLDILPVSTLIRKIIYNDNKVSIYTSSICKFKSILDDNPPRFIMEFPSVSFSGKLEGAARVGVINRVLAYDYENINRGINTIVVIELKDKIEPLITEDTFRNIIQLDFSKEARTASVPSTRITSNPPIEQVKKSISTQVEKRVTLSFKDADIKDVLQALSVKAGVNIVIDEGITKKITLVLNNVTAKEALEMITKASGLAYEKWDNGYIVATPKRLIEILDSGVPLKQKEVIETIEAKGDPEKVLQSIKVVYPEIIGVVSNKIIVIKGEESRVKGAIELAKRIDVVPVEEPIEREIVRLKGLDANSIKETLSIITGVTITAIKQTNSLIIQGAKSKVKEVKELLSAIDIEPTKEVPTQIIVEAIEIKGDPSQIQNTIKAVYPEIVTSISGKYIVIRGENNKVSEAKRLIESIDRVAVSPGVKEVIETIEAKGDPEKVLQSIKVVYPEIIGVVSNKIIVIKGEESRVKGAIELAKRIDVVPVEEPIEREIVRLKGLDANSIKETLSIITGVTITAIKQTNSLIIQGAKSKVKEVKELLSAIDIEPTKEVPTQIIVEAIEIKGDPSQIQNTIKAVYPEIVTSISGKYIVIRGENNKVSEAKRLIESIDRVAVSPGVKEVIETIEAKGDPEKVLQSIKVVYP
ncbi:MAG: secretin N-terminal domain-containing protein, partial [bacterium]